MKNLILTARAIPGTPRNQVFQEAIDFAIEQDCMVELFVEGVTIHVLPDSTIEVLTQSFSERQ